MNFSGEYTLRVQKIEQMLRSFLPEKLQLQQEILDAMEYNLLAGGKRLRPMLMRETFSLFGGTGELVEPFMAAIEMIHTYSLIHDDLPAMDDDDYRRGKKTTHIVYGEDMGILTGDALLNYAFEVAAGSLTEELAEEELRKAAKALKILSAKSGIYGMIGGQVVDVRAKVDSLGQILFIYQLKTGALIEGAMMIGAVLAGATEQQVQAVEEIAANVGLAFQIQDDILDETGTQEQLGKSPRSDQKNEKVTYVTLQGLCEAQKCVERLSLEAVEQLRSLPGENPFLEQLLRSLMNREM